MLVFSVLKDIFNARALAIVILAGKVNAKFCNGGHICSPPKECCPLGCCLVFASPGYHPTKPQVSETSSSMANFLLWNHWLFWILLVLLLLILFCGCGLWKKRQLFSNRLYRRTSRNEEERSEFDSTGSCYPPPQYSRCSSFHYAPPPYTEVTSKPDLYPLVISYRPDNGKYGDNCVMVQYFRNYVVHPALSTAGNAIDSINSGFFPQSVQDVDSNHPPSYEESRIGETTHSDLEPVHSTSQRIQSTRYPSQEQILGSDEVPQITVRNAHESLQKTSSELSKRKIPATTIRNGRIQSNSKDLKSRVLYLSTVDEAFLHSNVAEGSGTPHPAHRYTSDVILAQPQRYCESNGDLHYDSSDILNNFNHYLHRTNGSYSSEDNLSQARGSLQDFVSSDGLSHSQFSNLDTANFSTSSEISSLQGCGTPDSPPRAISPTGEFRNLLEKIQQLPSRRNPGNGKPFESKSFEYLTDHGLSPSPPLRTSEPISPEEDFKLAEKLTLLDSKPESNGPVRPNELSMEKLNITKRSKTFYLPFRQVGSTANSSRKVTNNSIASCSAPVTPINPNHPSPSAFSFHFLPAIAHKLGSRKSLESRETEVRLLLKEEDENEEERENHNNHNH